MQNQTIIELLKAGLFNPQNIDVSLIVLDALQFEGKESIMEKLTKLAQEQKNAQNILNIQNAKGLESAMGNV